MYHLIGQDTAPQMIPPPEVGDYVRPLGYSYTLGQGRLHNEGVAQGDYHTAYQDAQYVSDLFQFAMGSNWDLNAVIQELGGYGPIPPDVETTSISDAPYDAKDITIERHVYFYDFQGPQTWIQFGAAPRSPTDLKLCLNLSGYSPSNNKWMVPSDGMVKIPYFTLKSGTRLSDGQWEHYTGLNEWGSDKANFANYMAAINALIAIIGQTYGSELTGLYSVAESTAITLIQKLPLIANAVQSGNSTGLLSMFAEIGIALVSDTLKNPTIADDIKNAIGKISGGQNLQDYLNTAGKTVTNVINQVGDNPDIHDLINTSQTYANGVISQLENGVKGTPVQILQQIASIRQVTPTDLVSIATGGDPNSLSSQLDQLVGIGAIKTARSLLSNGLDGDLDTPAAYFFDIAANAASSADIIANINLVPDYASRYYLMGATLRAAQLSAQENPTFRKYTAKVEPRPGGGIPGFTFWTPIQQASIVHSASFVTGRYK